MTNLAFNPDTMTVSDLKKAAATLRTLIKSAERDCWDSEEKKLEALGLHVTELQRHFTAE